MSPRCHWMPSKIYEGILVRPLQVVLLFLVRGILLLCAGGRTSATQLTKKTQLIASIFAHATSWKNCSTVLPGSPICSIFHGIKRLCLERQTRSPLTMQSLSHHSPSHYRRTSFWACSLHLDAHKLEGSGRVQAEDQKQKYNLDWPNGHFMQKESWCRSLHR